ncbi:hypothetical protein CC85DRAFT_289009 [Cutaneotrichosporon oleaginosum]|uniref:Uncharacterized protein n=1 Tax=Cutaneotrichosporon oleaginosum TaxID=879819 RepID=A0A0J1AUM3_9TREE|nr:uncharacterized protein CC85DRAFT_289009 [Cutaneotrichosporon oleaginosum]KLT38979.1 hypothetical protein CC85DRAFT_289009 [Cutaneotrichosporon oleaginosum]TXT14667.1 hypothetical protein COLE_00860 [Cutaneotrichosporon oleaginosum]
MSDKETLISMGFDAERIDWALRATKNAGLQPAMDHILAHNDEPVPTAEELAEELGEEANIPDVGEAKSIKCSECGKTFRSQATASFHAEKSGHTDFEESTEEIKPLTAEEKAAKLIELKEKLAAKRAAQSKEDEKAARANEALRRKAGQDSGRIKEEMQAKELEREAARKRQEKIADQKARAAVKAQIEADKRERAAKAAAEKAARDGKPPPEAVAAPPKPAAMAAGKSSEAPETRLQIRLHVGGAPLVKTFPSTSTLVDVAEFVSSENLAYSVDTVRFATTFPRKTFAPEDMRKSLKDNGLTPSAVLMASL